MEMGLKKLRKRVGTYVDLQLMLAAHSIERGANCLLRVDPINTLVSRFPSTDPFRDGTSKRLKKAVRYSFPPEVLAALDVLYTFEMGNVRGTTDQAAETFEASAKHTA